MESDKGFHEGTCQPILEKKSMGFPEKNEILFLIPPGQNLHYPSGEAGSLKTILVSAGIKTSVEYLNFSFFNDIAAAQKEHKSCFTADDYKFMVTNWYIVDIHEWLFTDAAWDCPPQKPEAYYAFLLESGLPEAYIQLVKFMRSLIPSFLQETLKKISWDKYSIITLFTELPSQFLPCLAIARWIKENTRGKTVVLYGYNFSGSVGETLIKKFPYVDFVVRGEGENVFYKLIHSLLNRGSEYLALPGICYRVNGKVVSNPEIHSPYDVTKAPLPDHSDYFAAFEKYKMHSQIFPSLIFAGSRGCWWGEKSHCTFCGLDDRFIQFRFKSPERAFLEIETQVKRHRVRDLFFRDFILPPSYFNELFPRLKDLNLNLWVYTKTNLKKYQIFQLKQGGVRSLQPGIETLHDNHLKLMRKGTTVLENLQFLKWCLEYGILVNWNFLTGMPGESPQEYKEMEKLIPFITHLPPPIAVGRIRAERNSPYFVHPEEYGIYEIKPYPAYSFLYPWEEADIFRVAYMFQFRSHQFKGDPENYTRGLRERVLDWQKGFRMNLLTYVKGPNFLKIYDKRDSGRVKMMTLEDRQMEIYLLCDEAKSPRVILEELRKRGGLKFFDEEEIISFLDFMVSLRLMLSLKGRYLSLAVPLNPDFAAASMMNDYPAQWRSEKVLYA